MGRNDLDALAFAVALALHLTGVMPSSSGACLPQECVVQAGPLGVTATWRP